MNALLIKISNITPPCHTPVHSNTQIFKGQLLYSRRDCATQYSRWRVLSRQSPSVASSPRRKWFTQTWNCRRSTQIQLWTGLEIVVFDSSLFHFYWKLTTVSHSPIQRSRLLHLQTLERLRKRTGLVGLAVHGCHASQCRQIRQIPLGVRREH